MNTHQQPSSRSMQPKDIVNELAYALTQSEQGSYEKNLVVAKEYLEAYAQSHSQAIRERVEGMKKMIGSGLEISKDESLVESIANVMQLKEEVANNQALDDILALLNESDV